ncbi:MAG: DinB family protein [Bacteroidia bacterium]|nr:DinB family protein [Bacteroidia bacterium]
MNQEEMKHWKEEIQSLSKAYEKLAGELGPDLMHTRPHPDQWSFSEILAHLIVINESYYPTFKALQNGTYKSPFLSKLSFMVRFMGKEILKSVQPQTKKKIKTFPIWEPIHLEETPDILNRFLKHQEELTQEFEACITLFPQNPVLYSPASKMIFYHLSTAFEIILSHEKRHLLQAQRLLEQFQQYVKA